MNKPNQTSPPARNPPPGSAWACFNRFEGVGEVWTTYLISDPNLTLTPKNLYFINGFEGVGEERLMTSGCVLTFL